jgi:hypothetical protein
VQYLAHFGGREIEVFAARIGTQETEAFRVGDDRTGNEVELARNAVATAAVLDKLAVAQHRREALGQRIEIGRGGQMQRARHRFDRHRAAVLFEQFEDRLATRDRPLVTLRLALGIRIGETRCGFARARRRRWHLRHECGQRRTRWRLALLRRARRNRLCAFAAGALAGAALRRRVLRRTRAAGFVSFQVSSSLSDRSIAA